MATAALCHFSSFHDSSQSVPERTRNDKRYRRVYPQNKSIAGDKCYKQGYIKKESVRIIKRSLGSIVSSHFSET